MRNLTDLTTQCIRCGFCLESCPTFVETGEETESPRGRIYLVRSAEEGKISWRDAAPHLDRCLGCLACTTACPSGVRYGEIFEQARDRIEQVRPRVAKKLLLASLTSRKLARLQLSLGKLTPGSRIPRFVSRALSGENPEADKPRVQRCNLPELDHASLPGVKGEVHLLRGCVMDVLYQRVHACTVRLLRRIGYVVTEVDGGCCGSLHLHAGYIEEAKERAQRLSAALEGDLPIVVDSAGCGSTMKSYHELWSIDNFGYRVLDVSEFLLQNGLAQALANAPGLNITATYHDACHLAHGQGVRDQPRSLLSSVPGLRLMPLPESDMCCGSAGIYNVTQPAMARTLLERKWSNIVSTGAGAVVLGNPGCHAWIAQAAREHGGKVPVLHTVELLEAAFIGLEHFTES